MDKGVFREIEAKVAKEEMQDIQNMEDLVNWFGNFGDMRVKQLEEIMDHYPDNEEIAEKCQRGIDSIREIQKFKPE